MKASLISILSNLENKHKITFNKDNVVIESGSLLVSIANDSIKSVDDLRPENGNILFRINMNDPHTFMHVTKDYEIQLIC
jgi:hypothetical protein